MRYLFVMLLLVSCSNEPTLRETIYCTLPPSTNNRYSYTVHKIYQKPEIDGKENENSWKFTRWNTLILSDLTQINYKILWKGNSIFFLLQTAINSSSHRKFMKSKVPPSYVFTLHQSDSIVNSLPFNFFNSSSSKDMTYKISQEKQYRFIEGKLDLNTRNPEDLLGKAKISFNITPSFIPKENFDDGLKVKLTFDR